MNQIIRSNRALLTSLIQFLMGFGLGYYGSKAIKYILATLGVLIIGSLLSIWSINNNLRETLPGLKTEVSKTTTLLKDILASIGILTIGPLSVGFILGLIIGVNK